MGCRVGRLDLKDLEGTESTNGNDSIPHQIKFMASSTQTTKTPDSSKEKHPAGVVQQMNDLIGKEVGFEGWKYVLGAVMLEVGSTVSPGEEQFYYIRRRKVERGVVIQVLLTIHSSFPFLNDFVMISLVLALGVIDDKTRDHCVERGTLMSEDKG